MGDEILIAFLNQVERVLCRRFNLNLEKWSFLQMIVFLSMVAFTYV